jgi:hypothetical protein
MSKRKSKKRLIEVIPDIVEEPLEPVVNTSDLRKNRVITELRAKNSVLESHLFKAIEAML